MSVREELEQLARDNDMDYFGVASVNRFSNLPVHYRPTDLFPEAKCVIVLGMALIEGAIHAQNEAFRGNRIEMPVFTAFGFNKVNDLLNIAALKEVRLIEKKFGGTALPIPSFEPHNEEMYMDTLSNRYAAMCAGLGEMTWSGLVATPEYGPRVRWVSIITDLDLAPDPFYQGEKLCRYPECHVCVDCCPAKALSASEKIHVNAGGEYETDYAKRDKVRCRCAISGLIRGTPGRLQAEMPEQMETMEDWFAFNKKNDHWSKMEFHHGNFCLRCMTQCPIGRKEAANG